MEASERISELMKCLSHRQREIVKLRHGLTDGYRYTLKEVAQIFKITRERVRQIEAKAFREMLQASIVANKQESTNGIE